MDSKNTTRPESGASPEDDGYLVLYDASSNPYPPVVFRWDYENAKPGEIVTDPDECDRVLDARYVALGRN